MAKNRAILTRMPKSSSKTAKSAAKPVKSAYAEKPSLITPPKKGKAKSK
jgi:hypothetical protein